MAVGIGAIGVGNIGAATAVTSVAVATSASGSNFEVIVIPQGANGATAPTITDNKGNSALYTQIPPGSTFNNGNNGFIYRFIAANGVGGAGHTVTATFGASISGGMGIILLEMTGCALSSPVDQTNTGTSGPGQTTGPGVSGNITVNPPPNGEILVSVTANQDSSAALVYSEANGFTIQASNTNFATNILQWAVGTKIVSSSGTYSASWSWGGLNLSSACLIDSFKGVLPSQVVAPVARCIYIMP